MGHLHSFFMVLSGLAYSSLLFSTGTFSAGTVHTLKICMILIAIFLWSFLFLYKRPELQVRALIITQIVVIILSILYYYFYWDMGVFSQWSQTRELRRDFIMVGFPPILGYIFLSLSVRVLTRKLRVLRQVDRLRD